METIRFNMKKSDRFAGMLVLMLMVAFPAFADAKQIPVNQSGGSASVTTQEDPWAWDSPFYFQELNPFRDMQHMRQAMNRMFDWTERMSSQGGNWFNQESRVFAPPLDVVEQPDKYLLKLDLPGMEKDKLDIRVMGQTLTLSGERKFEKEDKEQNGVKRLERSYGYFERSIPIPRNVKTEAVTAKYDRGVLEIVMPKLTPTPVQEPDGRKIAIE